MTIERIGYFIRMARGQFNAARQLCPNCGGHGDEIIDTKMLVSKLRRCNSCEMQFRTPTDSREESHSFYRRFYQHGFGTEMPDDAHLQKMMSENFAGQEKDYRGYVSDLKSLGLRAGARVFDFGCSWGYGSWQIQKAGFDVTATEINPDRSSFAARKLDVKIVDDPVAFSKVPTAAHSFDCFFTSHVIEHVPSPQETVALAKQLLKPGGIFICHVPNGSDVHRQHSADWHRMWGNVHPNYIDDRFLLKLFAGYPAVLASRERIETIKGLVLPSSGVTELGLEHYELVFACRIL
jgi:2-polyprenyl-3-methyl-5-hydroxy-6-metoxy-1,4-benzoquinol methylase